MSQGVKDDETNGVNDSDETQDSSPDRESPSNLPTEEHKLQFSYWLWFRNSNATERSATNSVQNYEQSLAMVGQCDTVEQWWGMYSHLTRPDDLPNDTSFHLFKVGVRPMWEDGANINGGKWEVRLRRNLGSWAWEEICMAIIGEQFDVGEEICGAVINIRLHEVVLAVWHKTASDQVASACIQDTIRQILHLPPWSVLEYKIHGKSLRAATFTNVPTTEQNSTS
ncbi:eukaryotic translation initiation factor 4E homologous protein isoform X2 [Arctopsyche grandis]|uniref:eukaryotic translation initiation factor 4E homologous protein isoform X2 n=1 Tax=Arctopsyche grandis TaxID=121162 RepID=UPI00406D8046